MSWAELALHSPIPRAWGSNMPAWCLVAVLLLLLPLVAAAGPQSPGLMGRHRAPDFVDVCYTSDSRDELLCTSAEYELRADLTRPSITSLARPLGTNVLAEGGIVLEIEAADGRLYSSRHAPKRARQNTWRTGFHYADAHLLDFELATEEGETAPLVAELVLNCFPDKINLQAIFHVKGAIDVRRAEIACHLDAPTTPEHGGLLAETGDSGLALSRGEGTTLIQTDDALRIACPPGEWAEGEDHEVRVAVRVCGAEAVDELSAWLRAELSPLGEDRFEISGGVFGGYDSGRGLYIVHSSPGRSDYGFEGFWNNPNMYLTADVAVRNDRLPRRVYIMHDCPAGPVESGVLTDVWGFPLPVLVEVCKNFGGEMEEPVDVHFSETYYPLDLAAGEQRRFLSHHLHQNWGDHPLRQLSSIRFFEIYYHLSHGTTETTCFSLPTKFGSIPGGARRAYTVADYRPLSGQTWIGQPQHEHVALQGWLQYDDGEEWRWPVFKRSTILSAGPNLAWFIQDYESSDGKVSETVEAIEMPQAHQLLTSLRIRYDFNEAVTIAGDPRHNLRLLNKGSYIRRVHWDELAWLDEGGVVRTAPMKKDGQWSASGEPMLHANSFVCAYPHVDGNDAVIVRGFRGRIGGEPFDRLGFSAIEHENQMTELFLTPLIEGDTIPAGSWLELDCILMPYGDDTSDHSAPHQESVRHGLNAREMPAYLTADEVGEKGIVAMGPTVEVSHGVRILDLPPAVRAEDNWAAFTLSGAHDRVAVVAAGFAAPKLPMLWEGTTFIDQQARGGDGYQVFADADGTYGFVFAPRTRTTRRGGKWQTTTHRYLVTQAVSEADISAARTVNGEVVLEVEGDGLTAIDSPRLWCPARNTLSKSRAVNRAETSARRISTVLAGLEGSWSEAEVELEACSSEGLRAEVTSDAECVLQLDGMMRDRDYRVRVERGESTITTSSGGRLSVSLPAGRRMAISARLR